MIRSPLLRRKAAGKRTKILKSKGMKGRTPTVAERATMDKIGGLGCIACRLDGIENPFICLHHIDGRTRPDAHKRVLPLCAGHHQAGTGEDKTLIAVHPDKARFEERYGTQAELLALCMELIGERA